METWTCTAGGEIGGGGGGGGDGDGGGYFFSRNIENIIRVIAYLHISLVLKLKFHL